MLVEINNLILEVLMDPHGSSWLLKRKRTPLSKSFQPIRTGTERNEKGKWRITRQW